MGVGADFGVGNDASLRNLAGNIGTRSAVGSFEQNANPLGIERIINGRRTRDAIG